MPLLLFFSIALIYWVFLFTYFIHIPSTLWTAKYLYFKYGISSNPSELHQSKQSNTKLWKNAMLCEYAGHQWAKHEWRAMAEL